MTNNSREKESLRKAALASRNALKSDYRVEAGLDMAQTGAQLIAVLPGDIVSGFFPIRSECDIRPLMSSLREAGARLCLPAIIDKTTIVFRELLRGTELIDMGFGTVGPGPDAETLDPAIMLVPLAAFDGHGNRIGYGGGYYDRAIANMRNNGLSPRLIGIAFDCQEVEAVPIEPHDIALDAVLTESGLRQFTTGC